MKNFWRSLREVCRASARCQSYIVVASSHGGGMPQVVSGCVRDKLLETLTSYTIILLTLHELRCIHCYREKVVFIISADWWTGISLVLWETILNFFAVFWHISILNDEICMKNVSMMLLVQCPNIYTARRYSCWFCM